MQALESIPNQITFSRLLLLFPLWYTAILGYKTSFAFFLLLAGFTDFLDGYLARRLNQSTHFGAAFDSFADNLVALSLIFWAFLLIPEVIRENTLMLIGLFVLLVVTLGLQLVIYHRFLPLHLYLGKTVSVLLYPFVAHAVVYGYSKTFFYLFVSLAFLMLVEELIIVLLRRTVDERTKTLFH